MFQKECNDVIQVTWRTVQINCW